MSPTTLFALNPSLHCLSASARDTTLERSSLHTALLTSGTSAHSLRTTLVLRTERSHITCSATMLLSCCVFLDSLLGVAELVSNPQPPHRSGHGCTVGFDRDRPTRAMTHPDKMVSHQSASSCLRVCWCGGCCCRD